MTPARTVRPRRAPRAALAAALAAALLVGSAVAQPLVRSAQFGGANPEAQRGGTVRFATVDLPNTFNPFTARILSDAFRINILLPALVVFNGATLAYECYLCSEYTISDSGTEIEYTLREGVLWSDGTPITVDDVLTSVQLHSTPEVNSRNVSSFNLGGVPIVWERTGERTIRQVLPKVDAAALDLANWPVVPAHVFGPVFEAGGAAAVLELWNVNTPPSQLVAGGPFMVREFRINEELVLERNPNYFVQDEAGVQLPYLDRFVFQGAADPNATLAAFLAGETDLYRAQLIDEVLSIQDAIDARRIDAVLLANIAPSGVTSTVHPNYQNVDPFKAELFRDVRFRRALSHLIDREGIIELALGGLATPLYGPFSSGNTRFYDESAFVEGETKFSYDPEAAAVLLAELGFTSRNAAGLLQDAQGRTISFVILANASEPVQRVAGQIVTEDFRAAGIEVVVSVVDTGSVINPATRNFDEAGNRGFDWLFTNFGGVADPPTRRNLYNLDGTARIWNLARPGQPQPDQLEDYEVQLAELLFAALETYDEAERRAIYREFQQVAGANLPLVYLYTQGLNFARSSRLGNTQEQLGDPVSSFEGSQNGFLGQVVNFIDVLYVRP
jgi:peptide/nickel transport system substrate-binding protein